jgi:hypothetical protein
MAVAVGSGARRYGAPLQFAGYRGSQAAGDGEMITPQAGADG